MGSSTRKIQDKIKRILNPNTVDGEPIELEKAIPIVSIETLRIKKTKKYFGDKDFLGLMQGGITSVQAIKGGTFKEYIKEYTFDLDVSQNGEIDEVITEKILEAILNKIENESEDIESTIILRAFKITMAKILLNKEFDIYQFVFNFCTNVLFLIIMENINESMIDLYKDKNISDYDSKVKQFATTWVDKNIKETINEYINGRCSINDLIDTLTSKVENAKGDFNV